MEYKNLIPVTVSRKDSTQFIIRVAERFILRRRNKMQTVSPSISQNPPHFCQCPAFSSSNRFFSPSRNHSEETVSLFLIRFCVWQLVALREPLSTVEVHMSQLSSIKPPKGHWSKYTPSNLSQSLDGRWCGGDVQG